MRYHVIIIGGGLTGSHAAYRLAQWGLRVAVLEEHPEVGRPWFCTGIVGKQGFDRFLFSKEVIQRELSSASFFSPSGARLQVSRPETQAYVLNRAAFDRYFARMARESGAEFFCSTRCKDVEATEDGVRVKAVSKGIGCDYQADVCLVATGIGYALHHRLGLGRPSGFLDSAQVEVKGWDFNEVEVYLGSQVAPASFAWVAPIGSGSVRVGVTTRGNAVHYLKRLLALPGIRDRIELNGLSIAHRVIPLGPISKSYGRRLMAVGDAAGQVKPTTGGGIYYGLLCSGLAAETAQSAFELGQFGEGHFKSYETGWKKKIGLDLSVGLSARKLLEHCTDDQIDTFIGLSKQEPISRLIKKYANFDRQKKLILALSKMQFVFRQVGSLY